METFSELLALCAGIHQWIPRTKASDAELWCFPRLNKRLNKQSWGWWFETPSLSLWRHCNVFIWWAVQFNIVVNYGISQHNCVGEKPLTYSRIWTIAFIFRIPSETCECISYNVVVNIHLLSKVNTLRLRQNRHHFADDVLKSIFLNENVSIPIEISLKFVPKGPNDNIPVLVQIMAWRRPDDKPLSEPMMVRLPTHICVTRPQWVNLSNTLFFHGALLQK